MRLKDKVAFITGGTKGIGEQIARRFAEEGARVAICGRSQEQGEKVAASIREAGGSAMFVRADISSEEDVSAAVKAVVKQYGALHILINNAAPTDLTQDGSERNCVDQSAAEFDSIMRVGIGGTVSCCRHAIPEMTKSGGGAIVNISSFASIQGVRGVHAYTLAKGAMNAMTRQHAVDYAAANIRSNCIVVGLVITEPVQNLFFAYPEIEAAVRAVSLTRMGTPNDIAEAALYLASDAAAYVTGVCIPVDGGISCRSSMPDVAELADKINRERAAAAK